MYSSYDKIKSLFKKNDTCNHCNKSNSLFDDYFKIVLILDESGSMQSLQHKMIDAINDLIKEQKQIYERPTTFTFVKFNHSVNRVIKNKNLNNVDFLNYSDYSPSGSTALYDAIGDTINWFNNEKNVLMVIVTDGQENASRKFSKHQISSMIENKKIHNNWTYVYLSNDLDTFSQGNNIGFERSSLCTNQILDKSAFGSYLGNTLNSAITEYRTKGVSVQKQLN